MVISQSNIPAADYLVNRDPWLKRYGGREAGKRISEQLYECCPPILRGRPIYDRLPGAAQAYNKDQDTFINKGTIILPEAKTIISSAEDVYFRSKFPEEYEQRDYITGSFLGPGSVAALYEGTNQALKVGDNINGINVLLRSGIFFFGEDRVRDATNISKKTIDFPGAVIQINPLTSGWLWIDGNGNLNVSESLPDGIANLTGNIWCDPNADIALGQTRCAERVNIFRRDTDLVDTLDVGDTGFEITWPPNEECEIASFDEVAPIFKFATDESGTLTVWEDFRIFNTTFDPPIARYLLDYWDNLLQSKREQIDVFIDDSLIPDTVGKNYLLCEGVLRQTYRDETFEKILDSWDFGIITTETLDTIFNFLGPAELLELSQYDSLTHTWLDWLAQHFGLQDNGTINSNYWHRGSQFENVLAENEVFYTIAEKRAILRNALGQDPFQTTADTGELINTFPIWNLVTDFWDLTSLFWNSKGLVPAGTSELVFTRFPFTTYNRIKPANWQGLMKEKGTRKSLDFMFDVLGLHGYACTQNEPRFDLSTADFQTPLIPFKFANSVVIEYRKEIDPNGNIVNITPLEPRIGNYDQTGIVRAGETILSSDYDRKLVVRAPFGWARNSQQFNRMQEISRTYVREGELVTGYYNFLTGLSAAGEPVWFPEECTACKYVGTSWASFGADNTVLSDFYNNTDEYGSEEFTWIQNLEAKDTWNGIGFDRDPDFRNNIVIYPIYVENRTILALQSTENSPIDLRQLNTNGQMPIVASYDNGKTFEPIVSAQDANSFSSPLNIPKKLRHFAGTTYLVEDNVIISSDDAGASWREIPLNGIAGELFDIFHDVDRRRTYVFAGESLYGKTDAENTYTELFQITLRDPGGFLEEAIIRSNGTEIMVFYAESDTSNNLYLGIHNTPNFGVNNFIEYQSGVVLADIFNNEVSWKLRAINNSINRSRLGPAYIMLFSPKGLANEEYVIISRALDGTITEHTDFYNLLDESVAENRPQYVSNILGSVVTDIKQNYRGDRYEYFVTSGYTQKVNVASPGDPASYYYEIDSFGEIYSSNNILNDVLREQENFKLYTDNTTAQAITSTGDFIIKRLQTEDIDAAPIDEEIDYINKDLNVQICAYCSDSGGPILEDIPIKEYTLYIPVIDTLHPAPAFPGTLHTNENNNEYLKSVAIHADDYLTGWKHIHWEIPKNTGVLSFTVTNNDIVNPNTGRQFIPFEAPPVGSRFDPNYPGNYNILEIRADVDPVRELDTGLYEKKVDFKPVYINMVGISGTDTKTVTFKLIPIYGHYYNNFDDVGGGTLAPYNQIFVDYDDIFPDATYPNQPPFVNEISSIDGVQINLRELHHPIVRNEIAGSWTMVQTGFTSFQINIDPPIDTDTRYELSWQADIDFTDGSEVVYSTSIKLHHEAL